VGTLTLPGETGAMGSMAKSPGRRAATRRTYHHGDLRRTLLSTALQMAEEEDVSALTLREVARRAKVTHSAPYHHFPTRAALLAALAEEGFRALYTEQLQAAAKAGADPVARLRVLGTAYVRFAVAHPGYFRVMYRSNLGGWVDHPSVLEAAQLSFVLLTSTAHEAVAAGKVDIDVMDFVLAAWSVVHGLATLWVDGPLQRVPALTAERGIEEVAERITALSTARIIPG
jgi:AcrR family transcriptional regulator